MQVPKEILIYIANDSYRAWQLIRLTCQTYYDLLGCYYIYNEIVITYSNSSIYERDIDHNTFIKNMLIIASCCMPIYLYIKMVNKKTRKVIVNAWSSVFPAPDVHISIDDRDSEHICRIFNVKAHHNIRIYGVGLLLEPRENINHARTYMHDNLPELYRAIHLI